MTFIPIVIDAALGKVTKWLIKGLGNKRTSGDHPDYCIIEIGQNTCCHSNSSEKPPANADVKNSQGVIIIIVIIATTKIGDPLKKTNRNLKPGLEIRLETQIRNLRQQPKMLIQRKNAEINQKVLVKERKTKKLSRQYKTIQTKQDIPK